MTNSTRVVSSPDTITSQLDSDLVILFLPTSRYYTLNRTAALVWNYIQSPQSLADTVTSLASIHDVERDTCERDVRLLMADLCEQGLASVVLD